MNIASILVFIQEIEKYLQIECKIFLYFCQVDSYVSKDLCYNSKTIQITS